MDTENAKLAPLMFLEGNWKGEGVDLMGLINSRRSLNCAAVGFF